MKLKVAKFGGTSLANAGQIRKVCDIVAADPARRIIVVSAPGKQFKEDTKVTDLLIALAEKRLASGSAEKELNAVLDRFAVICSDLKLPAKVMHRIEKDLRGKLGGDTGHKTRFTDTLKAAGEDNCAWLTAAFLEGAGRKARYVNPGEAGLVLSAEYGNAVVLEESYARLSHLRDSPDIVVFPGFYGVTPDGNVVTFPRGGSDITGAVLAAAVRADVYENFTDVDSVFAVDPHIVPDAAPITEMTYREMRELAYAGFKVFHEEAIAPVVKAGIPICIKNTNKPSAPGTTISPERKQSPGHPVGIAGSDGFCTIFVSKYMMNRELGFGRRLLQIIEEEKLSYEHTPSGIDNMSVILAESRFTHAKEEHVTRRIRDELGADVSVERGLALIMIVGEALHYAIGAAAKATAAFAQAGVNIEMMNQGSSEISMMFGVKAEDRVRAMRSLYEAFFARA